MGRASGPAVASGLIVSRYASKRIKTAGTRKQVLCTGSRTKRMTKRDELRPVFVFQKRGKLRGKKLVKNVKWRKKKWAEARREEEEDFNLSPWFV
jgi:hypothetical protein